MCYLNKKIHVIKYVDEVTYVFTEINNNKKSYLIDTYSFNKDLYANIKLLLDLLKKGSVILSRSLKVLEKLENSKQEISSIRKVSKKICDMLGSSKFYRYFNVEPYENRFCDTIFDERKVFKNTEEVIYLRLLCGGIYSLVSSLLDDNFFLILLLCLFSHLHYLYSY